MTENVTENVTEGLTEGMTGRPPRITAAALGPEKSILHGFFGRQGGVSSGLYSSLNCGAGSDDDPGNVAENKSRVLTALGLPQTALRTVYQVHGRTVITVTGAAPPDPRPEADALVTATPGIALGILTADCVPILFADHGAQIIGAAHAGWKGALSGVAEATIDKMVVLGARRGAIAAVLGPSIGAESYEVGADFPAPFLSGDSRSSARSNEWFRPSVRPGHHMFDLGGYLEDRLRRAGVGTVERIRVDTCAQEDRFFSYRRSTLRGEPDYGRELSVIALPG